MGLRRSIPLYYVDVCHTCAGNEKIYGTHDVFSMRTLRSDDPDDPKYCHPTLYWYAFWLTISEHIVVALIIIVIILYFLVQWFCAE